ncbi:MAG: glycosyltransferase family 2 protein [Patescibacteria group bacterium]|jgi:hypothetical protein
MSNNPRVSIVILNWNGLSDTMECLNSLKNINYDNYEVILVDNNSKNSEAKILKDKFGNFIKLICNNRNYGFAEGNNIGISAALKNGTDYVLCLNNDTVVEPNFLREMIKFADNDVGMIGGIMINYYDQKKIDNEGILITKSGLSFSIKNDNYKYLGPCGGAALYSTKMLRDIEIDGKYFDSDFFMYAEDVDLAFRGHLLGYKALKSEKSFVYHKISASSKSGSDFSCFYNQRNHIWLIAKNFPVGLIFRYGMYILLGQITGFFVYLKRRKLKLFLKSKIDAFKKIGLVFKKRNIIQKKIRISNKEIRKLFDKRIFLIKY